MQTRVIKETAEKLYDKYRDYMDFYERKSVSAKVNGTLKVEDVYALGKQLENFENWKNFNEANGGQGDLGLLPNIALDVITASNVQSVIPLFASVQPLDEVQGTIWYRNIVATNSRGNINGGDVLASGYNGRRKLESGFAGEEVFNEVVATGDGSTTTFTFTTNYPPVLKRTITITVEGQPKTKGLDDGDGNLIGVGITSGQINYENGAATITFNTAPDSGANVLMSYATDFEGLDEIPTIKDEYTSKVLKARSFALRTEIGLFKSYQISKRFGTNPEEILAKDLVQELNAETSAAVITKAYLSAPAGLTWSKTAPSGVSYAEHKLTFFDTLAEAEAQILGQAGRFNGGSVYVVGTSAAAIIRTMPGFRPADTQNAVLGTHYYGDLDGKPVIRSIVMPANEMLVISKGSSFFDTAVVYAPSMDKAA